jgi:hypothetical protein
LPPRLASDQENKRQQLLTYTATIYTPFHTTLYISSQHMYPRLPFASMADILSLPASSPLHDLFEPHTSYFTSYPSSRSGSSLSTCTVQRRQPREHSSSSQLSANAFLSPHIITRTGRNVSYSSLRSPASTHAPSPKSEGSHSLQSVSLVVTREPSFVSAISKGGISDSGSLSSVVHRPERHICLVGGTNFEEPESEESIGQRDLDYGKLSYDLPELPSSEPSSPTKSVKPFRRWMSTLRRRRAGNLTPPSVTRRSSRWTLDNFDVHTSLPPSQHRPTGHRKSDSWTSSLGFVAGMKSATATLASVSIAPLSRRASKWRRGHNRSSIVSGSDPRPSVDTQRSILDEASRLRSKKRREKVEELIRTEESYIADLKALSNVLLHPLVGTWFHHLLTGPH